MAAHYCCELGEAALAAGDFAEARAQVAAARVHAPDSARAALLAARIAAAAAMKARRSSSTSAALGRSRTIRTAFESEARQALHTHAGALDQRLRENPPRDEAEPPEPPRFRCEECGVASVTWHWRCPSCRNWDSLRTTQNRGN